MTWYTNKTKREAVTGSYGAWLSPEGELTPVDYQEHAYFAGKILGEKTNTVEAEEKLLNMGYVALKFLGGLSAKFRKGLSDIQVKKILNLYKTQPETLATVDAMGESNSANDAQELFFLLTDSKVLASDVGYKFLKKATANYGHWISPTGQIVEVDEYQGHGEKAFEILQYLGENLTDSQLDKSSALSEQLMELGWVKTAYEAEEMLITAKSAIESQQANVIQKLAQMAPKRLQMFLVEIPSKTRYIMRHQIAQLAKFLTSDERKIWGGKEEVIKTANGTKFIKTAVDLKKFEEYLKAPDSHLVNPLNQIGNFSNLFDVQRYVMDSYSTKTSMSKTKNKITISIITTHGFLGSVAFNKYWTFSFSEWKEAIKTYEKVNEVIQKKIEDFVDGEITSTIFWPVLKFELDKIEPERNTATTIPWVNYSRRYYQDDNPDWRQNIYGNRYPDYDEPSYSQELKRKGVFFD